MTHMFVVQALQGQTEHFITDPRGVHCIKHVRVYVGAQKGY